jgi:hypothetical protein
MPSTALDNGQRSPRRLLAKLLRRLVAALKPRRASEPRGALSSEARSRLFDVRTGSELLGLTPPAPLSATLVARPVRACIFVPLVEGVPWERLVEHALATQTRVWGGASNLVVPAWWELAEDEIFWSLIDRFDPDVIGLHVPVYADVEEIAPERYVEAVKRTEEQLTDLGFNDDSRAWRNQPQAPRFEPERS